MDFFCGLSEISETKGMKSGEISKKASEKFDRLMGDDNLSEVSAEQPGGYNTRRTRLF